MLVFVILFHFFNVFHAKFGNGETKSAVFSVANVNHYSNFPGDARVAIVFYSVSVFSTRLQLSATVFLY